jgi:hypothetical protein
LISPPAWIAGSGMAAEEVGMFDKHRSVCVANATQGCALRRSAPLGELTRPPCLPCRRLMRRSATHRQVRPLQGLRLVPWCAHPHVPLFVIRQDHQHGLGMDRLDRGDHIDAAESRFCTDDFRASFRNKDKDNQLGPYSPHPPSRTITPSLALCSPLRRQLCDRLANKRGRPVPVAGTFTHSHAFCVEGAVRAEQG